MSAYKLQANGCVVRQSDGAWIPPEIANADWKDFQAWLEAGNTPDPVDPP